MTPIKNVCVYCGASTRVDQLYRDAAARLSEVLALAGYNIVYGGGRLGLMGVVADNAIAHGAHVTGFIPKLLEKYEGAHPGISDLHVVDSMHTRKQKMSDLADAFIILPGGFGTLDELFEITTWRQLQLHDKPIIVVNINGYWDPLKALIHKIVEDKFAIPTHGQFIQFVDHPDEILDILISTPEPEIEFASQHI